MKTVSRTFVLVSWCVLILGLSGPGCSTPCEEQGVPLYDNRDHKAYPNGDDWICVTLDGIPIDGTLLKEPPPPPPPPAPPPPPDVSGEHPADPPGPKDPDAVVEAAIILNSCFADLNYYKPKINKNISQIYFDVDRYWSTRALFQRVGCFKDKANGCDAMRECIGMVEQLNGKPEMNIAPDPIAGKACADGTSYYHDEFYIGDGNTPYSSDTWINCDGLGSECKEYNGQSYCATIPFLECDPATVKEACQDDRPYRCDGPYVDGKYYAYQEPKCSDYGMTCGSRDCVGTGASCVTPLGDEWSADTSYFSYKAGTACESATVLRACVGTNESLVDCTTLGQGFTCIPGPIAHCGFASECDDKTPVTCEGDSLVLCDAGRVRKVDCKSLGFTRCISNTQGGACSPGVYDSFIKQ